MSVSLVCHFNHFVLFSRDLEESVDQGDQLEKLDQRLVKYLTSTFLQNIVLKSNFLLVCCLFRVTQETTAHQDLPERG